MLSEALTYLFAKCQNKFKSLGYLNEAIAIESRYKRCRKDWSEHLKNSQQAIIKAVEKTKGRKRVVILGAGAGHDIPFEYLLSEFEEIHLVDVVFLRTIRTKAKNNSKIKIVESDVTGIINPLVEDKEFIREWKRNSIPPRIPPPDEVLIGADLVVSCNILSQLPINIKKRLVTLGEDEDSKKLEQFCHSIIKSHLDWLANCDAAILLITDIERHLIPKDKAKREVIKESALFGISLKMPDLMWIWNIAPRPEVDRFYALKHLVGSFYLREKENFNSRH